MSFCWFCYVVAHKAFNITRLCKVVQPCQDDCEASRGCKAEQKGKEWKVRAKGSSSELSSSKLTCSVCNRQFMGLYLHGLLYMHNLKTLG